MSPKIGAAIGAVVLAIAGFVVFGILDEDDNPAFELQAEIPNEGPAFSSALFQSLGVEMLPGHAVDVIDNGAVFDAIAEELPRAERSVNLLLYIWEKGRASTQIIAALGRRDRARVECRVLVDDFGSRKFDEDLRPSLEAIGCEVRIFRRVPRYEELVRNHRKLVIIDGRVAFTGGFGIRDDWLGDGLKKEEWRDVAVRFEGPAVRFAQQAFAENWQEAGGALLPAADFAATSSASPGAIAAAFVSSSGSPVVTRAERLSNLLIASAKKRLWISNAYFVPPKPLKALLIAKARAGVDVRVLTAGKMSDSKTSWFMQNTSYDELTEAGVRVFEYQPSMMHSKAMVIDDGLATIGSINLDPIALNTLEEGSLVFEDRALNEELARAFERDCALSEEKKD